MSENEKQAIRALHNQNQPIDIKNTIRGHLHDAHTTVI